MIRMDQDECYLSGKFDTTVDVLSKTYPQKGSVSLIDNRQLQIEGRPESWSAPITTELEKMGLPNGYFSAKQ